MNDIDYYTTNLNKYTPPPFLIPSAHLYFILDPVFTIVKAKLFIKYNKNTAQKPNTITLDGIHLKLQKISINSIDLSSDQYILNNSTLTILDIPNHDFILETKVIIQPKYNLTCTGLYLSDENFCTQNEPHGFRRITYFLDRPDILTKFTTVITANKNKYPILLSNGNLLSNKLTNRTLTVTWHDPFPKSSYLFAIVAGKFAYLEDYFKTISGRLITIRIYADVKLLDQFSYAMLSLKQAMSWEEQNFGLEYDLDLYQIVAINDFNFGAMENKGLNIFNSRLLLASSLIATDDDFKKIAATIAHEYFHNWTGNRVTCRDWFQIGLKEGLTTLREQLFMEDVYGYSVSRIDTVNNIYNKQFPEDESPLAHPILLNSCIEIDNLYTVTMYYKSAEIFRMIMMILGKEKFKEILIAFLTKYDGKAVTIEDFIEIVDVIIQLDFKQFKNWFTCYGSQLIHITNKFSKKNQKCDIIFSQKNKNSTILPVLIKMNFFYPKTNTIISKTVLMKQRSMKISINDIKEKPIISFLQDFSAPIIIKYQYTNKQLKFLCKHDTNFISLYINKLNFIKKIVKKLTTNKCIKNTIEPLLEIFDDILQSKYFTKQFIAVMLQFPTTQWLFHNTQNISIEEIYDISENIKKSLAIQLKNNLLEIYEENNSQKQYNLNQNTIGERAIKNICLEYLALLNDSEILSIITKQLQSSNNLNDTLAALNILANSNYHSRENVLEKYYQSWKNSTLLINKWLSINATINTKGNLKRILKLLQYPEFNIHNPNNVYALIDNFCNHNFYNFHMIDGSGYQFLITQILIIDKFNPNLAAHLAIPLIHSHKLDKIRHTIITKKLYNLINEPISPNLYEIVQKGLNQCSNIK